jgi:ketosteroid isomerase-like protein
MPARPRVQQAMKNLLLVLALFAASAAAAQTPALTAAPPAQLPSVTLPPALDRVLRDYESGWRAGDAAKLSQIFAADGFILQNGRAPVRGRDAIKAAYSGQAGGQLKLRALAYAVADTTGYIIGAYSYGESTTDMGKFTLTLRRARGGPWEIFSDMDNGNQPRRPQGAAPPPR